jgi:hypothetical protein
MTVMCWSMKATMSSAGMGLPSTTMRSRKSTRWGDVYRPMRRHTSRFAKQRLHGGDTASLPVRAGDVKYPIAMMRIPEMS